MKDLQNYNVSLLQDKEFYEITGGGIYEFIDDIAEAGEAFFKSFRATWKSYGR